MHAIRCRWIAIALFSVFAIAFAVAADQLEVETTDSGANRSGTMVRTDVSPIIDGMLDDEAWESAPVMTDLRQVNPDEGAPASESTEVRLLYDEGHVYIGVRCHDMNPEDILATRMQRDGSLGADDRVEFIIDTFHDRRNAYYFAMNPVGAKIDGLIENNRRLRREWDGIWEGKARIDEHGWTIEIAIPCETISFDPKLRRWGFNVSRTIRRRSENARWSAADRDKSLLSVADAGAVEHEGGMRQGLGLDIKPYAVASALHTDGDQSYDFDAGLDLFYHVTPSVTLALTTNTDFAEAEVDERRVNLSRFPLFFPEKRDFFLQDPGIFEFGGINRNPLPFFSRRIGLGSDGEIRDILVGAKLTGRMEDISFGLLDVQMKDDDELGSKNLAVARASINVLDESTVGLIATHGNPRSTASNAVYGADFNFRTSTYDGDKVLTSNLWYLQSDTDDASGAQNAMGFKLSYPNDRVSWRLGIAQIDEAFNAALGFVPRPGIREYFGNWRYRWRPDSDVIRHIDMGVDLFLVTNIDNEVESRNLGIELLGLQTERGDALSVDLNLQREQLFEPFGISDNVTIEAGDYRWWNVRLGAQSTSSEPFSIGGSVGFGDFYDGRRTDLRTNMEWRVSPNLLLGFDYTQNLIDLPGGSFDTKVSRARVNIFFTPQISWTNFVQWDNVSDSLGINSRLRWITRPGDEIFVVLNQAFVASHDRFAPEFTQLTSKIGYTFRF